MLFHRKHEKKPQGRQCQENCALSLLTEKTAATVLEKSLILGGNPR